MSEPAPAFQFYPKDFLSDGNVAGMSLAERGAYITLLCICWRECSLPDDATRLARMVGATPKEFNKIWPAVRVCFTQQGDRLTHRRLDLERAKQDIYRKRQSNAGRASAEARLNQTPTMVEPRSNHGSTVVQPEGQPTGQPKSSLRSPVSDLLSARSVHTRPTSFESQQEDQALMNRAGDLLNRYAELFYEHRKGARYHNRMHIDFDKALGLVRTWEDDKRLEKLAVIVLTTDDEWIARSDRGFGVFASRASWADDRLSAWEAEQKAKTS
jgi:uncharacterized protein YdaU (DUF1376 family)